MKSRDVVIVGGGPAGRTLVHALHAADSGLSVTLIKDEPVNVNRCAVPYGIPDVKPLAKFQIPNTLVTDFGAEMVVDAAVKLDPARRVVETAAGDSYGYGHLLLATGARPLVPPIPGIDAANITFVRSLDDLQHLRDFAAGSYRAVVVGGGYIGVEMAVVLRQLGLSVALVERLPNILSGTTEPEMTDVVEAALRDRGVHLETGAAVTAFERTGDTAAAALLVEGNRLEADFFVIAVGVTPNTSLAESAGIETGPLGIRVDDHLRSSAPRVYAAGDCAATRSFFTGDPVHGEFGTNAVFMSRVVAANILGDDMAFPGVINANASTAFEWSFGGAGLTEAQALAAGFDIVTGYSEVLDKYPMMDGTMPIRTKLTFDTRTRRLLGGSVLRHGHGAAQSVDFLSLACQLRAKLDDILAYQYTTHPELAAKPSDNGYVFAARQAQHKLAAVPQPIPAEIG